jgi:tetratricopeptide (TPR) repeat protein
MRIQIKNITPFLAATLIFLSVFAGVAPAQTQSDRLDELYAQLLDPPEGDWESVEQDIWKEWSKSGSDAMDLLLERGNQAMADGDLEKAVEHFTALTDHAPEFAEGWNARATAFFLMEEYGLSIADIQTTLKLNPKHFGALAGLGMIFENLDQPENALRAYKAAKAVHPLRPNIVEAIKRLEEKTQGTSL